MSATLHAARPVAFQRDAALADDLRLDAAIVAHAGDGNYMQEHPDLIPLVVGLRTGS